MVSQILFCILFLISWRRIVFETTHFPINWKDERLVEAVTQVLGQVAAIFEEAAGAGALDAGDAGQRTRVLWATVHGLDHMRKRDRRTPCLGIRFRYAE